LAVNYSKTPPEHPRNHRNALETIQNTTKKTILGNMLGQIQQCGRRNLHKKELTLFRKKKDEI